MTQTAADQIAILRRGLRQTVTSLRRSADKRAEQGDTRSQHLKQAAIEVDALAEQLTPLIIETQLHTIDGNQDCTTHLDRAHRIHARARHEALQARTRK